KATEMNNKTKSRSNSDIAVKTVYCYEFSQPKFFVSKIYIEHDEQGKRKITFQKNIWDETVTDTIQLTPAALEKIKIAYQSLNFLDSTEDYQDKERDYSHLGNLKFTIKKDGRERTVAFNWTQNKDAKTLQQEYYKIGMQYIWIFDINVARQNQPLEAPGSVDALDGYLNRSEIYDQPTLIPSLQKL